MQTCLTVPCPLAPRPPPRLQLECEPPSQCSRASPTPTACDRVIASSSARRNSPFTLEPCSQQPPPSGTPPLRPLPPPGSALQPADFRHAGCGPHRRRGVVSGRFPPAARPSLQPLPSTSPPLTFPSSLACAARSSTAPPAPQASPSASRGGGVVARSSAAAAGEEGWDLLSGVMAKQWDVRSWCAPCCS